MLPSTAERVSSNTADHINERIRLQTEANVARYHELGPAAVARRLEELDQEWDIERYLETMAPTFTLLGLFLGATVSKKWLVLPVVVQTFSCNTPSRAGARPSPFCGGWASAPWSRSIRSATP